MKVRIITTATRKGFNQRTARSSRQVFDAQLHRVYLAIDLVNDDQVMLDMSRREALSLSETLEDMASRAKPAKRIVPGCSKK